MTALLVWYCAAGDGVVFGGGFVGADHDDINGTGPVAWRPWHDTCHDPDATYCIDVERIRTPAEARGWTAHLVDKNWYPRSNWREVMAGQGIAVTFEEITGSTDVMTLAELRSAGKAGPW